MIHYPAKLASSRMRSILFACCDGGEQTAAVLSPALSPSCPPTAVSSSSTSLCRTMHSSSSDHSQLRTLPTQHQTVVPMLLVDPVDAFPLVGETCRRWRMRLVWELTAPEKASTEERLKEIRLAVALPVRSSAAGASGGTVRWLGSWLGLGWS